MRDFKLMHALTAKNALFPLNVYSVALYPKAKAPPTVTTKLMNDKMWEFMAFTEKNKNKFFLVIYANNLILVVTQHLIGWKNLVKFV